MLFTIYADFDSLIVLVQTPSSSNDILIAHSSDHRRPIPTTSHKEMHMTSSFCYVNSTKLLPSATETTTFMTTFCPSLRKKHESWWASHVVRLLSIWPTMIMLSSTALQAKCAKNRWPTTVTKCATNVAVQVNSREPHTNHAISTSRCHITFRISF